MTQTTLPKITVYTDGACHPNPGPGGWAAILLRDDQEPHELAGKESYTTNNRMELRAAAEALRSLSEPHQVDIYTDSKYVRQGITEWLPNWVQRNWQTMDRNEVKNKDLWELLSRQEKRHQVYWHWVKGHAGNEWNERADQLATSQLPGVELPLDDQTAIHIFTAAAYQGKTKQGGWAVVLRYQEHHKTLSGHVANTSSNRMHLQAAVAGLQSLKKSLPVHIYTYSDYLKDGATGWIKGWAANEWQTKAGTPVSHRDLWEQIADFTRNYQVRWHVVPKSDAPAEILQAKDLATEAARQSN